MRTKLIKNNVEESEINLSDNDLLDEEARETEQDTLNQIGFTKKQLAQIKKELDKLVDSLAQNNSLLSRAAAFWGGLPWWQKVIMGSIIIVPLLGLSIVTHTAIVLTISLFTLVTYVATSLLLDNHHQQSHQDTSKLKKGILSLADALGNVINSLELLREELANEITKFQEENHRLNATVNQLSEQVDLLSEQVTKLVDVEQQLHLTEEKFKQSSEKLEEAVNEHTQLLQKNKAQFEETIRDYKEGHSQLSAEIITLKDAKTKLEVELDQAKSISQTLRDTVESLTNTVIPDEGQRMAFQERLKEFLADKAKSFDQINERICEAEHKLLLVQEELRLSNERYASLLKRGEGHIDRLERTLNPSGHQTATTPTETLRKVGFYADYEKTKSEEDLGIAFSASF